MTEPDHDMSEVGTRIRKKQLEDSISRIYEEIANPIKQSHDKAAEATIHIMDYHQSKLKLIHKCMNVLDIAIPNWKTSDNSNCKLMVNHIKDELTECMSCKYDSKDLFNATSRFNSFCISNSTVEQCALVVKNLDQLDSEWRTSMPGMLDKITFDIMHCGLGIALY